MVWVQAHMELLVATLCDSATESQGKLNVIGAFDTIMAQRFPAGFSFTLALRFSFTTKDRGEHKFSIRLREDGGEANSEPAEEATMTVNMPDEAAGFSTQNMIHPLEGTVKKAGIYHFDVRYDGRVLASVPLRVVGQPTHDAPAVES